MDYRASTGRFTTQDTWQGLQSVPQTQYRSAYALNNPINITDPSGHAPCYEDDNGNVRCGYGDPNNYPVIDNGGGGGSDNGGVDPVPPAYMNRAQRMLDLYGAAGNMSAEEANRLRNEDTLMFLEGYDYNLPYAVNREAFLEGNAVYGPKTNEQFDQAIQRYQQDQQTFSYWQNLGYSGGNPARDATCQGMLFAQASGQLHDSAQSSMAGNPSVLNTAIKSLGKKADLGKFINQLKPKPTTENSQANAGGTEESGANKPLGSRYNQMNQPKTRCINL